MLLLNRLKNTYLETHRVKSWDCRNGKVIPVSMRLSCLISINSVISAVIMTNICAWVVNNRAIRKHLNICCDPGCFCNKNLNSLRACICARECCNYFKQTDLVSFKQNGRSRNETTTVFGDRAANQLTHRQLEVHDCLLGTVATAALALKHQPISIHNADSLFFKLDQFDLEISRL